MEQKWKSFKGTEKTLGGTMRLGLYTAKLKNNSAIKRFINLIN